MTSEVMAATTTADADRLLGTARNQAIWAVWHLSAAAAIPLVLSELRVQIPLWDMGFQMQVFLAALAAAHLFAASLLAWLAARRSRVGFVAVFLAVAVPYGVLGAALHVSAWSHSRSVLMMAAGASFIAAAISLEFMQRLYRVLLPALAVVAVGMINLAFTGWPADDGVASTAFYRVRFVEAGRVTSEVRGGALEPAADGLLVAAGDGALYYVPADSPPGGSAQRLPLRIPVNRDRLRADAPGNATGLDPFRVADIHVQDSGDRLRVFASHHFWKSDERCFVVRVSRVEVARAAILDGTADGAWQTLYDSTPCLSTGEIRFEQSGGQMIELDAETLLVTIGDHSLDGYYAKASVPQDPASHYGKTVRLNVRTGTAEVYTLGHRNPQGLHRTPDGRIWLAEQGPAGGDELNLLTAGANYGWPLVTYGVAYEERTWPLNAEQGRHAGYVEPWFAWVPSIALTSVISVQRNLFPVWKGDLLVSSLRGAVLRIKVGERGVVLAEPLYDTGTRIRDMIEAPDGRLALLSDEGTVGFIEPVGAPASFEEEETASVFPHPGARVYTMCQNCHSIGTGSDHGAGPDLRGVVGRDIAAAAQFDYSPALRALDGEWTDERLDAFLANPAVFVPGTTMATEGIGDAATRRLLIDYLRSR